MEIKFGNTKQLVRLIRCTHLDRPQTDGASPQCLIRAANRKRDVVSRRGSVVISQVSQSRLLAYSCRLSHSVEAGGFIPPRATSKSILFSTPNRERISAGKGCSPSPSKATCTVLSNMLSKHTNWHGVKIISVNQINENKLTVTPVLFSYTLPA